MGYRKFLQCKEKAQTDKKKKKQKHNVRVKVKVICCSSRDRKEPGRLEISSGQVQEKSHLLSQGLETVHKEKERKKVNVA